jgi:hypothetical protein
MARKMFMVSAEDTPLGEERLAVMQKLLNPTDYVRSGAVVVGEIGTIHSSAAIPQESSGLSQTCGDA